MTIPSIMQYCLTVAAIVLGGLAIRRVTRVDYPLACLCAGLVAAFVVPFFNLETGIRSNDVQDLVFFVLLPLLIFISAWHIDLALLKRWFAICFILATVGVVIVSLVTAAGLYYGIAHPGFPWVAALLAAVIMSATDPVSVAAQLKASQASRDLETLFEGESLFNDATVIVLFGFLLTYATGQEPEENVLIGFASVLVGGVLIGVMMGGLSAAFCLFIKDKSATVLIVVFTSFASFYVAEGMLHVSGILSVMFAAITSRILLEKYDQDLPTHLSVTFNWLDLFLNGLVFGLLGLFFTLNMLLDQWLAIVIAIVCTLVSRMVVIFLLATVSRASAQPIPYSWALLLSWGGLKGAIAVALVLSLPVSLSYWWTIQSMVFGVVLFSLVIQGGSFAALYKKLESTAQVRP